jgi:aspartate racemase
MEIARRSCRRAEAKAIIMLEKQEKVAGILGGMGPEATVDLMRRIIRNTPAEDDIDHIRCIVDNNPKVPSRIKALIEGTGENPAPAMADMARRLEAWGADFLCIACNTAHNYYQDICKAVDIPVLNMVNLTVDEAMEADPATGAIGILASPAVRITRLYEKALTRRGIETVYTDPEVEEALLDIIRRVKKGDTGREVRQALAAVVCNLRGKGVRTAIVACTELGVIMEGETYEITMVDAAEVLAKAVVRQARANN